jgi:hypothetical protein
MSADDKTPPWIRVSTHDMTSSAGRYILGARTARDWANYGRWFALQQILAGVPESVLDVSAPQRLKSLAHELAMTPKACSDWLAVLSEGGAIDSEAYESKGLVFVPDVYDAVTSYQSRVKVNRANGARGGRRKAAQEQGGAPPQSPQE